jgi:hypothetical protein
MIPVTDVSEALILALQQVVRHSQAAIVPLISTGKRFCRPYLSFGATGKETIEFRSDLLAVSWSR